MANVLLTRIDNRLIHGQVATQWVTELCANKLIVANDEVANDDFRQQLMNMAAPAKVKTEYLTIEDAAKAMKDGPDDEAVFVIVENPLDAKKLVDAGAPVDHINVGNMHMAEGKHQIGTTVAVDDADIEIFNDLKDKGVELFIQRTPGVAQEDSEKLFKA